MHEQKPYIPKRWPTWITTPAGNKMIVKTCQEMSAMMGEEYDENAELVVKKTLPPSMEEILGAGYSKDAAEGIFAREQAKAEQGIEPYGPKPVAEFVEPPATTDPPKHEETVEDLLAKMAEQSAAAHAAVLHEMDPMGIFATPEPDEPEPTVTKRGKAAKE